VRVFSTLSRTVGNLRSLVKDSVVTRREVNCGRTRLRLDK